MTIVYVKAVDWSMAEFQIDKKDEHEFDLIHAEIIGFLVEESEERLTVTQQQFESGSIRYTLSIPKACIVHRKDFELSDVFRRDDFEVSKPLRSGLLSGLSASGTLQASAEPGPLPETEYKIKTLIQSLESGEELGARLARKFTERAQK